MAQARKRPDWLRPRSWLPPLVSIGVITAVRAIGLSGAATAWVVLAAIGLLFVVIVLIFAFGGDAQTRLDNVGLYLGLRSRHDREDSGHQR